MRHHHRVRAPPQTPSHRRAAHKGATPRLPAPRLASPRLPTPPCRASSLPAHPRRRRHVCPTACAGASLPPAGPLRADDALAARCHLFAGERWGDIGRYSAATSSPLALHLPSSPHIPPHLPTPLLRGRRDACSSRPRAALGPSPGTQSTFGGRSRRQQPTQSRSTRRLSTSARRSRASGSRVGCPRRAADRGRGGATGRGRLDRGFLTRSGAGAQAKLIVLVRNPVQRSYSHWKMGYEWAHGKCSDGDMAQRRGAAAAHTPPPCPDPHPPTRVRVRAARVGSRRLRSCSPSARSSSGPSSSPTGTAAAS